MTHLLLLALLAADPVPADAPVQKPVTLVYPDGGRCENAAAAKAEDKLLTDARVEPVRLVLAASGVTAAAVVVLTVFGLGLTGHLK